MGELLIDELRDILHAEKQLTKALPRMAKAARFDQLRELFEQHLIETEQQIERLNECFSLLGATARAKPCKGMMGLVEEGQEIIEKGGEKEDAPADLALIGAAQRVEHYEMSGYSTARNLAQQLRHSAVVALTPYRSTAFVNPSLRSTAFAANRRICGVDVSMELYLAVVVEPRQSYGDRNS